MAVKSRAQLEDMVNKMTGIYKKIRTIRTNTDQACWRQLIKLGHVEIKILQNMETGSIAFVYQLEGKPIMVSLMHTNLFSESTKGLDDLKVSHESIENQTAVDIFVESMAEDGYTKEIKAE